jgi:hypothetical protein
MKTFKRINDNILKNAYINVKFIKRDSLNTGMFTLIRSFTINLSFTFIVLINVISNLYNLITLK